MATAWHFAGWFYRREGQCLGPLTAEQVRSDLAVGRVRPTDPVWQRWTRGADYKLTRTSAQAVLDAAVPFFLDGRPAPEEATCGRAWESQRAGAAVLRRTAE